MHNEILAHEVNRFNSVEVHSDHLPEQTEVFQRALTISLRVWKEAGHNAVWLEIPIELSRCIAPATAAGFLFHHSTDRTLTLLFTFDTKVTVPSYATHYIGAGGVVLNDRDELLVVSERYRRDRSQPYYKLPGGALHPGEHLIHGVVREVREETGVEAAFEALVCFRHWHGFRWNKSDIYFICRLSALTHEISIQPSEIEEARWMPVGEYLVSEYVSPFNRRVVQASLSSPGISPEEVEGYSDPDRFEFFIPR